MLGYSPSRSNYVTEGNGINVQCAAGFPAPGLGSNGAAREEGGPRRTTLPWSEQICAENIVEYWPGMNIGVPQAAKPDF